MDVPPPHPQPVAVVVGVVAGWVAVGSMQQEESTEREEQERRSRRGLQESKTLQASLLHS